MDPLNIRRNIMRDPSRIPIALAAIHNLWKRDPDLRLGQILVIAASKAGRSVVCPEIFYLEDDELLRGLAKFAQQTPKATGERQDSNLWERFHSDSPPPEATFRYNQHVRVVGGEFKGAQGFIIDLNSLVPEPIYRVERMDTGFDITVEQSNLELAS